MKRVIKSSTCANCGNKINFEHDEFSNLKGWGHAPYGSQFCKMKVKPLKATPIEEASPQPDPDGDTARDDLIGQLAMLDEQIAEIKAWAEDKKSAAMFVGRDIKTILSGGDWREHYKTVSWSPSEGWTKPSPSVPPSASDELEALKQIVQQHRRSGKSFSYILTTKSYKRLEQIMGITAALDELRGTESRKS